MTSVRATLVLRHRLHQLHFELVPDAVADVRVLALLISPPPYEVRHRVRPAHVLADVLVETWSPSLLFVLYFPGFSTNMFSLIDSRFTCALP